MGFMCLKFISYLLKIPPRSEALRHSGGDRRRLTSAMVTLYFEVELSRESLPGTEQNRSVGFTTHVPPVHNNKPQHIKPLEMTGDGVCMFCWGPQMRKSSICKLWKLNKTANKSILYDA